MSDLVKKVMDNDLVPSFIEVGGTTGFEAVDSACIAIPFIRLAQSNSPEAQPGTKQIKGLSAGKFFNPSTGRIYGDEPRLIILGFYRSWNVWFGNPPEAKFVTSISNEEFEREYRSKVHEVKDPVGKVSLQDSEGKRYQDTRNFFLLSADYPEDGVLLYPMASTGIPPSKKWMAKASAIRGKDAEGKLVQAPMYSRVWKIKPTFVQSPKGNYYQISEILDEGWIPGELETTIKHAFEEAQSYIRDRVVIVETAKGDETPDWVNEH